VAYAKFFPNLGTGFPFQLDGVPTLSLLTTHSIRKSRRVDASEHKVRPVDRQVPRDIIRHGKSEDSRAMTERAENARRSILGDGPQFARPLRRVVLDH